MASNAFRLRLPERAATEFPVGEFALTRAGDVTEMARRVRLLGVLANLPVKRRDELAKAVAAGSRLFVAAELPATVAFGIGQDQRQPTVEVVISSGGGADPASVPSDNSVTRPRKRATKRSAHASSLAAGKAGTADVERLLAKLHQLGQSLLKFDLKGFPGPSATLVLAQAAPTTLPNPREAGHWAELLAAKTWEDAMAIAQRDRQPSDADWDVGASRPASETIGMGGTSRDELGTLSLIVSRATNAILIMDGNGLIQWANDAFALLTGYSAAEVVGRGLDEVLFGPSTAAEVVKDFQQALRNGHEFSQDVMQYHRDGRTFWVECKLVPVQDDEGRLSRWIVIQSDVTRRRQTEEALRAAKQAAESNSRAKSEFLANMSHEIRTPLNAILGMTELALTTDLTREQRDYLRTVHSSADTLLQLLNDVLDLSKIEAGKMEIEEIDFNLAEVVRETLKALAVKAREKGLELAVHMPVDVPPYLRGDPTRFRQILFNLVGNAIKFTERGEVVVNVEEQWRAEDEIGLHFSVRDTGIGVPKEKLQRIFDSFAQADSSTARRFGGSGLGLTITAQILRMMNGKMWVRSKVGHGSTFHFTLPLKLGQQPHGATSELDAPSVLSGSESNEQPTRQLRVLVVDDHEANRSLAIKILERRGHHCLPAADGDEAIAAVSHQSFDTVLMDVQMPGLDGFAATRAIREREKGTGSHVPIIAITAHALSGDREKCLAAGMDAYLAKPLHARELVAVVERVTGSGSGNGAERSGSRPGPIRKSPFDISAALDRMDGEQDLLREHMGHVLNDLPQLMDRMRTAVSGGDARLLEISAHRLKSLVSSYDHAEARELAQTLERLGKDATFDGADEKLDRLATLLDEFSTAVRYYVEESWSC